MHFPPIASLTSHDVLATLPLVFSLLSFVVIMFGWRKNHDYMVKAQKKHYFDRVMHQTGSSVAEELMQYQIWLIELAGALEHVYRDGRVDLRYRQLLNTELLDNPRAKRWFTVTTANRHVLRDVLPDLGQRANALMVHHLWLHRKAMTATNDIEGTETQHESTAKSAADEVIAQSRRVEELREMLLIGVYKLVFPDRHFHREASSGLRKDPPAEQSRGLNETSP